MRSSRQAKTMSSPCAVKQMSGRVGAARSLAAALLAGLCCYDQHIDVIAAMHQHGPQEQQEQQAQYQQAPGNFMVVGPYPHDSFNHNMASNGFLGLQNQMTPGNYMPAGIGSTATGPAGAAGGGFAQHLTFPYFPAQPAPAGMQYFVGGEGGVPQQVQPQGAPAVPGGGPPQQGFMIMQPQPQPVLGTPLQGGTVPPQHGAPQQGPLYVAVPAAGPSLVPGLQMPQQPPTSGLVYGMAPVPPPQASQAGDHPVPVPPVQAQPPQPALVDPAALPRQAVEAQARPAPVVKNEQELVNDEFEQGRLPHRIPGTTSNKWRWSCSEFAPLVFSAAAAAAEEDGTECFYQGDVVVLKTRAAPSDNVYMRHGYGEFWQEKKELASDSADGEKGRIVKTVSYKGHWRHDRAHTEERRKNVPFVPGVFTMPDGSAFSGPWADGQPVTACSDGGINDGTAKYLTAEEMAVEPAAGPSLAPKQTGGFKGVKLGNVKLEKKSKSAGAAAASAPPQKPVRARAKRESTLMIEMEGPHHDFGALRVRILDVNDASDGLLEWSPVNFGNDYRATVQQRVSQHAPDGDEPLHATSSSRQEKTDLAHHAPGLQNCFYRGQTLKEEVAALPSADGSGAGIYTRTFRVSRHGYGVFTDYMRWSKYRGFWKDNKMHGFGTLQLQVEVRETLQKVTVEGWFEEGTLKFGRLITQESIDRKNRVRGQRENAEFTRTTVEGPLKMELPSCATLEKCRVSVDWAAADVAGEQLVLLRKWRNVVMHAPLTRKMEDAAVDADFLAGLPLVVESGAIFDVREHMSRLMEQGHEADGGREDEGRATPPSSSTTSTAVHYLQKWTSGELKIAENPYQGKLDDRTSNVVAISDAEKWYEEYIGFANASFVPDGPDGESRTVGRTTDTVVPLCRNKKNGPTTSGPAGADGLELTADDVERQIRKRWLCAEAPGMRFAGRMSSLYDHDGAAWPHLNPVMLYQLSGWKSGKVAGDVKLSRTLDLYLTATGQTSTAVEFRGRVRDDGMMVGEEVKVPLDPSPELSRRVFLYYEFEQVGAARGWVPVPAVVPHSFYDRGLANSANATFMFSVGVQDPKGQQFIGTNDAWGGDPARGFHVLHDVNLGSIAAERLQIPGDERSGWTMPGVLKSGRWMGLDGLVLGAEPVVSDVGAGAQHEGRGAGSSPVALPFNENARTLRKLVEERGRDIQAALQAAAEMRGAASSPRFGINFKSSNNPASTESEPAPAIQPATFVELRDEIYKQYPNAEVFIVSDWMLTEAWQKRTGIAQRLRDSPSVMDPAVHKRVQQQVVAHAIQGMERNLIQDRVQGSSGTCYAYAAAQMAAIYRGLHDPKAAARGIANDFQSDLERFAQQMHMTLRGSSCKAVLMNAGTMGNAASAGAAGTAASAATKPSADMIKEQAEKDLEEDRLLEEVLSEASEADQLEMIRNHTKFARSRGSVGVEDGFVVKEYLSEALQELSAQRLRRFAAQLENAAAVAHQDTTFTPTAMQVDVVDEDEQGSAAAGQDVVDMEVEAASADLPAVDEEEGAGEAATMRATASAIVRPSVQRVPGFLTRSADMPSKTEKDIQTGLTTGGNLMKGLLRGFGGVKELKRRDAVVEWLRHFGPVGLSLKNREMSGAHSMVVVGYFYPNELTFDDQGEPRAWSARTKGNEPVLLVKNTWTQHNGQLLRSDQAPLNGQLDPVTNMAFSADDPGDVNRAWKYFVPTVLPPTQYTDADLQKEEQRNEDALALACDRMRKPLLEKQERALARADAAAAARRAGNKENGNAGASRAGSPVARRTHADFESPPRTPEAKVTEAAAYFNWALNEKLGQKGEYGDSPAPKWSPLGDGTNRPTTPQPSPIRPQQPHQHLAHPYGLGSPPPKAPPRLAEAVAPFPLGQLVPHPQPFIIGGPWIMNQHQ